MTKKHDKFVITIMILIAGIILFGILTNNQDSKSNNSDSKKVEQKVKKTKAEKPTVLYYKTVPVKIVEIVDKRHYVKSHSYFVSVKVKSEDYHLEETLTQRGGVFNGDEYIRELYNGELKEGDTIYAEMLSWKKGDKVVRRELSQLKCKD